MHRRFFDWPESQYGKTECCLHAWLWHIKALIMCCNHRQIKRINMAVKVLIIKCVHTASVLVIWCAFNHDWCWYKYSITPDLICKKYVRKKLSMIENQNAQIKMESIHAKVQRWKERDILQLRKQEHVKRSQPVSNVICWKGRKNTHLTTNTHHKGTCWKFRKHNKKRHFWRNGGPKDYSTITWYTLHNLPSLQSNTLALYADITVPPPRRLCQFAHQHAVVTPQCSFRSQKRRDESHEL